jgi:pyridoxal phosphate enzyme (YggS family)
MIDVAANWTRVCERAAEAAQRAGRAPSTVRIVAVSKTKPVDLIAAAVAAGVTDVGENYVQEAAAKIPAISAPVIWHFIGHLQRNKAGRAVELFDVIQTVDSTALAEALQRQAERRGRTVRVLLEVNLGGEASKTGVAPPAAEALLAAVGEHRALQVDGLMAIPPPAPSPDAARPYFRALRQLRDRLLPAAPPNAPLRDLSMGMSDDFEAAIEEGATMVRIGRAIFGERPR